MTRMKKIAQALLIFLCLAVLAAPALASGTAESGLSADEALKLLKDGNARYVDGKASHPHQDAARRGLTAGQGQHPFATVLSCSDSRVPVEVIFDQGLGDLFVVRVAGNVAATDEIGSMEYAVDHLGTRWWWSWATASAARSPRWWKAPNSRAASAPWWPPLNRR